MLSKKVADLLRDQVNKEFYSSYLYLEISNYYKTEVLDGFANWYKIQAKEELDHALLIMDYLHNNGETVTLEAIDKPNQVFTDYLSPLNVGLKHERYVTGLIHGIYSAAYEIKDFRTMQFLDWFVKEQGEEEKNSEDLIKKYQMFGGDSKALYMLDNELKERTYSAPPTL